MKFHSLARHAFALLAALVLASCGGGGAQTNPNQGGDVSIVPDGATFYAGAVGIITVSGGRAPYSLTSSDPGVLPVPAILNGHSFEVVPNNPGVIDTGLPPGAVPIHTVNIIARDSLGLTKSAAIHVAQNFLTGYGIFFTPSNCTAQTCAGGETVVTFDTVTNGQLYGLRPFRVEIVRAGCLLENPLGSNTLSTTFETASDHEGKVTAVIRCPAGTASGVGLLRLVDIGSGASTVFAFTISDQAPSATLEAIPDTITFTGPDSATCGTGTADFFVFGGAAPYTAVSSKASITVTPSSDTQPGKFTVSAGNPALCEEASILVTDSRLAHITVDVKTEVGAGAPPSPPVGVSPSTMTLTCGQSQSALVTGATGTFVVNSNDPNVTFAVSGNVVTVTRAGALPVLPGGNTLSTVTITDSSGTATIRVTNPVNCS